MLFELVDNYSKLQPVEFCSLGQISRIEKDLEDLLARHLFDVLFQERPLLPFHQETPFQPLGDIYAINQNGDIVIFELKRGQAGPDALDQLLSYAGKAGLWSYSEIERMYRTYAGGDNSVTLKEAHASVFGLEPDHQLREDQFNKQQHLWVVGSAADDQLIRSVDFWKSKGLSIDFFPYRIYQLGGKAYFEFFAKPYDRHLNPADRKGVLFNTNRRFDYEPGGYGCLRDMLTKGRVAAYGSRKEAVSCFQTGDYVFYFHTGRGIVGAAKVTGHNIKKIPHEMYEEEWYWDVELITPVPTNFASIPAMSIREVKSLLGKDFCFVGTVVYPALSIDESDRLIKELTNILASKSALPETGPVEEHPTPGGA
jgi:hypothetical protein